MNNAILNKACDYYTSKRTKLRRNLELKGCARKIGFEQITKIIAEEPA